LKLASARLCACWEFIAKWHLHFFLGLSDRFEPDVWSRQPCDCEVFGEPNEFWQEFRTP
jgi:hypothetical protein